MKLGTRNSILALTLCLLVNSASSQPLGSGKWQPSAGCRKPKAVKIAGREAMLMLCDFRGSEAARGSWDWHRKLDLTTANSVQFDIYCENRDPISHFTAYFKSGGGWYVAPFDVEQLGEWCTVTLRKSEMKWEGTPAGWSKVEAIRLSAWRGSNSDTGFYISKFRISGADAAIAVIRGGRKGGSPEAAAVANYAGTVAGQLDHLGVPYVMLDDSDVTASALSGRKLVVLPYNPSPSEKMLSAVKGYMNKGGKLIVFYIMPAEFTAITGISEGEHVNQSYGGYFASVRPTAGNSLGIPAVTGQNSWNIRRMKPVGRGARVAAEWHDSKGVGTGEPAVIVSDNCIAMTHVYIDDDVTNKRGLLLAMVSRFCPEVSARAAERSLKAMGVFGPYKDTDTAYRALKAVSRRAPGAGSFIEKAEALRERALVHMKKSRYDDARHAAAEARESLIAAYCAVQQPLGKEKRLIWCHRANGVDGMSWDQSIKILADNGFTAVLPNMLWGGIAFYDSSLLPRAGGPDRIEECLRACKKHDVECHIWKVNWKMGGYAPDSFVRKMKNAGRTQVSFGGKGQEKWLCPSHPENRKLEVESMLEIVRNYDVDGIHFDYIRYPGNDNCFCGGCRTRFEARLGRRVGSWPADVRAGNLLKHWNDFRRDNITAVVREVSEKARKIRPGVKISAAVFKNWPSDRNTVAQDWKLWCEKGYLDFVCPMDYTPSSATFEQIVKQQRIWAGDVPCYPGIGLSTWSRSGDICKLIEQIKITRKHEMGGFTIFEYGSSEARDVVPLLGLGLTRKN